MVLRILDFSSVVGESCHILSHRDAGLTHRSSTVESKCTAGRAYRPRILSHPPALPAPRRGLYPWPRLDLPAARRLFSGAPPIGTVNGPRAGTQRPPHLFDAAPRVLHP